MPSARHARKLTGHFTRMIDTTSLRRLDARAVRVACAGLGTALGVVWVVALGTGATSWLTWMIALAALACFGTVALVPERRAGIIAAMNLGFVAAGLSACWVIGLVTSATVWLLWCCFGGALLILPAALGTGLAAGFDLL